MAQLWQFTIKLIKQWWSTAKSLWARERRPRPESFNRYPELCDTWTCIHISPGWDSFEGCNLERFWLGNFFGEIIEEMLRVRLFLEAICGTVDVRKIRRRQGVQYGVSVWIPETNAPFLCLGAKSTGSRLWKHPLRLLPLSTPTIYRDDEENLPRNESLLGTLK